MMARVGWWNFAGIGVAGLCSGCGQTSDGSGPDESLTDSGGGESGAGGGASMISGSGGGGDTQSLASQAATSLASTTVASATAAAVTSIGDSMAGQTSAASTGAMNVGGEGSGGGSGNTGGTGGDSGSIGGTGGEGGDSSRWYAPCEMTPDVMTECAATAACPEGPAVGQRCDLRCADPSLCPPDGTYACGSKCASTVVGLAKSAAREPFVARRVT